MSILAIIPDGNLCTLIVLTHVHITFQMRSELPYRFKHGKIFDRVHQTPDSVDGLFFTYVHGGKHQGKRDDSDDQ